MEENHTDSVIVARTAARENPSEEHASFVFEYRLVVPDESLKQQWYRDYSKTWYSLGLGWNLSYAVQRRRVDVSPSGQQLSEWVNMHFAKTVWQLLWECCELRNTDILSCHPLCTFVRAARTRVDEIDRTLSRLTERGLREDFEKRFQQRTSRLRNQERIALIRNALLQDFQQENAGRLEQRSALQAERERLAQGIDAPQLVIEGRTIPVVSEEQ